MFNNNAAADHGPLTSISALPPESTIRPHVGNRSSFDSIIDDEQRLSQEDSFEKTHYRSSMSSDSVFSDDYPFQNDGLLPPNQLFRPLSVHSIGSIHSPMKEDDTMISVGITSNFFAGYKVDKYICTTDARRRTRSSSIYAISR
jgi:serine/arginine repetitive matrix protein 2